jgi:DNA polymerase III subunit alpha
VCGIITSIRTKLDKKEQMIAFAGIEDFTGKAECIFWSESYARFRHLIQPDALLMVVGRASIRGSDAVGIVVEDVIRLEETPARFAKGFAITVQRDHATTADIQSAYDALSVAPSGKGEVYFNVYNAEKELVARYLSNRLNIAPTDTLTEELIRIFGNRHVRYLTE